MRRLLILVGAIILVDTTFFAALTPLLPGYVEELGLSKAEAGLLAASYPIGVLVTGIPSGFATARFGVKPTLLAALGVMAVTTLVFGLAESYAVLLAARFAQGLASAFAWTAGLSWLVASADPRRRGALIGSALAAAIAGALVGPVLGAIASVVGTALAFGAVAVAAAALAIWVSATPAFAPQRRQTARVVLSTLFRPRVLGAAWFVVVPALLFGVLGVLAPLRLDELGVAAVAIGATFLVSAAFEAAVSPILGRVSDRHGRMRPLRAGLTASTAVAAVLPWISNGWLLAACVVLAGISFGSFWAPALAQLTDLAEQYGLEHAHGFALVNVVWAPAQAAGGAGGGALADATADAVPYLLLAGACALTLAAVHPWRSRRSS